jgi:hypothetical protein
VTVVPVLVVVANLTIFMDSVTVFVALVTVVVFVEVCRVVVVLVFNEVRILDVVFTACITEA